MIEEGWNGMKTWNAGGEICVKRKALLGGIVDLRHLVKEFRVEEERGDKKGIHIKEENCVKRKFVLRGYRYVDLKKIGENLRIAEGWIGGRETNIY